MTSPMKAAALTRLAALADIFEQSFQVNEENGRSGWGQFLDLPKNYRQVGLYGVSAGVIVLSLNEEAAPTSLHLTACIGQLKKWWSDRIDDRYASDKLGQNLRIGIMSLALRLANQVQSQEVGENLITEIEDDIVNRQLGNGSWGNWYFDGNSYDNPARSVFVTAIITLCLGLFRDRPSSRRVEEALENAAAFLEKQARHDDFSSFRDAVISHAAISVIRSSSERYAIKFQGYRPQNPTGIYFFDYESSNEPEIDYHRDYFLAPLAAFSVIAGYQPGVRSNTRLSSEETAALLIDSLDDTNPLYRPIEGGRPATLDQAWIAIALSTVARDSANVSGPSKLKYKLCRQRADNRFTSTVFPVIALVVVTAASALIREPTIFQSVVLSVGTLSIGGIYSKSVFRKLVRSR